MPPDVTTNATHSAEQHAALSQRLEYLQRADLILHHIEDMAFLLQRFLELMLEAAQAKSGTYYEVDAERKELTFAVVLGPSGVDKALQGHHIPIGEGIVGHVAQTGEGKWIPQIEHDRHWARDFAERSGYTPCNVICLPLKAQDKVIAVVQLFDLALPHPDQEFLTGLVNDLALKVENARLLDDYREMVRRQQALLDVAAKLASTLDRNQLLGTILDQIVRLIVADDASIFELQGTGEEGEGEQELVLLNATRLPPELLGTIRVPLDQDSIAGWVALHGETLLVPDVHKDPRWNPKVDELTSFVTHSILCTPLFVEEQVPGQEGLSRRRLVGVAQVVNKKGGGDFTTADQEIFEGLACQAAVALERVRLYQETSDLFTDAIAALAEAIDLRDPYTRGHTRRVTMTSVGVAQEMGCSAEEVLQIRLGALLHDIGKIGMPDDILKEDGKMTEKNLAQMHLHPSDGARILERMQRLGGTIRRGVAEHHERYDGKGYPQGLQGREISLAGRIIAVADTFDAITSNRPYRKGRPTEVALSIIKEEAGRQFDPEVVQAFLQAWDKGNVALQEQTLLPDPPPTN